MLTKTPSIQVIGFVALGLAAALAPSSRAAEPLERFTAVAVSLGSTTTRAGAGTVDITIDHWTTDQERDTLRAALREGGTDALLRALQKVKEPAGYIQSPGTLRYPLRFARQMSLAGGGRRLLLATDRTVSFLELANQSLTTEYPFMIIDIRLGADGKGQGKLLPLARVTEDADHVVEIENYDSMPVRLTEVRKAAK